ncbi:hypothetical protein N5580_21135 (plasmid) [Pantoea piersonii]|uniref:Uncharacterized protein n=1 Tax=Pantoea piersonii TaxID=2364647 RepID=A0AAJ5QNG6_9GAMM|nr:hypothetical protein [Pantoea piersonii]WBG93466.1 hypothetical protein N5580_21135 [Pantoea piersonii]
MSTAIGSMEERNPSLETSSNDEQLIDTLSQSDIGSLYIFVMRGHWDFLREFLRKINLEAAMSNGRLATFEKLKLSMNEMKKRNTVSFEGVMRSIKKLSLSLLTINNKAVYLLNIPSDYFAEIQGKLKGKDKKDAFHVVDTSENLTESNENPVWIDYEGNYACLFPSIKEANKRVKLDPKNIPGMEMFDSLYGFETKKNQYIDCLIIKNNKAYLLIDVTDEDKADFCLEAKLKTLPRLKIELDKLKKTQPIETKDIFNVIEKVCIQSESPYKESNYSVHEMDFVSPELSRYSGSKSPNRPDIRNDAFNKAGLQKTKSSLIYYKVSFNFDRRHPVVGFPYKLIVGIPGTYKRAATGNGRVDYFLSNNFFTVDDFNLIEPLIF